MSVSSQPKPLPEKPSDVVPPIPDSLNKLLETGDIVSSTAYTACICANCGLHMDKLKEVPVGCSRKTYCFACCEAKAACDCLKLTDERPFCYGIDACFCLKCVVCYNINSCCDFPFPCDSESHGLCCNWDKQKTVCGGASSGRKVCCNFYQEFSCLEKVEEPCLEIEKIWCLECRLACLPGTNNAVPMACVVFGKKLWGKE